MIMIEVEKMQAKSAYAVFAQGLGSFAEIRSELVRKAIHFLIAFTPLLASYNRSLALACLASGTLFYALAETARLSGIRVPVISALTAVAARDRDRGRFVLGPVTLGIGAMLSLLLYPNPAATIAIYSLAFGDGLASLVGKVFGRMRPAFLFGKSIEGSAACFLVVFATTARILGDIRIAFFAALTATLVEALPLEDYDNVALPMSVGLVVVALS